MPIFDYSFIGYPPQEKVAASHANTYALKKLNPPFGIVQLHRVDPMDEGSNSEFTLWVGPIPIHWRAVRRSVEPSVFTDSQVNGPLEFWRHTDRFEAVDRHKTVIHEQIEYGNTPGWHRVLSKLLFGRFGLTVLFAYQKLAVRWALK